MIIPVYEMELVQENPRRRAAWPALGVYRLAMVREREIELPAAETKVANSAAAAWVVKQIIGDYDREAFLVLCLNTKSHLVGASVVSLGTLGEALVHPREVFKAAILMNASRIVGAHNHPSGDPIPSDEDRKMEKRIRDAGRVIGIEAVDSLVIGETRYYSITFDIEGRIPERLPVPSVFA
jgi:DNA repair protein RadC